MSAVSAEELIVHREAIGRTLQLVQTIDTASLARFAAASGSDVPPLAHWAFFHDIVPDALVGADGHPRRGGFLPAIEQLPRRMFAASAIEFHAPLVMGSDATMDVRIADLRHKQGGSGDLVFLDVERRLSQLGALRIFERQTLVYLPAANAAGHAQAAPSPPASEEAKAAADDGERWLPQGVNLFRFSAATFNCHRIHYDQRYAREVEGYPDLVVHGPFIAARLAAFAARRGPLANFSFRASAPCFVDRPIQLTEPSPGTLQAIREDGVVSMAAKATYQ